MAESFEDMQNITDELTYWLNEYKMNANAAKCGLLLVRARDIPSPDEVDDRENIKEAKRLRQLDMIASKDKRKIKIQGNDIPRVSSYIYLEIAIVCPRQDFTSSSASFMAIWTC